MRKGVLSFIVLFCAASISQLLCEEIFAPFVSSLSASVEENKVTLTWKKAPSPLAKYVIYSSRSAISAETFSKARLIGTIGADHTSFTYPPPDTSEYFYAVLGGDRSGNIYSLFIPYRNILMQPVSVDTTLRPEQMSTRITNLRASSADNKIELTFISSRPNRSVILYRSTHPITESADLIPATALSTIGSGQNSFTDFPIPGVPYYYAAFDAAATKSGNYSFIPGENTLINAVEIALSSPASLLPRKKLSQRITPLPFLLLNSGILSGNQIDGELNFTRSAKKLTEDTASAWVSIERRLGGSQKTKKTLNPILLPADSSPEISSEEYQLSLIVKTVFSSSSPDSVDWALVEKQLASFLSVRHSELLKDRAHFYLGQVYYFQEKYSQSFFEFLLARDTYFSEVEPWIDDLFYLISL